MAAKEVSKDKIICAEGQSLDAIHIIVSGSVRAKFQGGEIILKKGDVVGLCDIGFDSHFFTYSTIEDSSFVSFPIKDKFSIAGIVKVNPEVGKMMYTSMINQTILFISNYVKSLSEAKGLYADITKLYDTYTDLASRNNVISRSLPGLDEYTELSLEDEMPEWVAPYYISMKDFPHELKHSLAARIPYLNGFLLKASEDIHAMFSTLSVIDDYCSDSSEFLMQDSKLDLFDLFVSLMYKVKQGTPDAESISVALSEIESKIRSLGKTSEATLNSRLNEYNEMLSSMTAAVSNSADGIVDINQDLSNSVDIILEYADVDEDVAASFKSLLSKYKKLSDKGSSDDNARKIRLELTKAFYLVYNEAFQMSVSDLNPPPILKMFFNFGYVDAELCGLDNANYLYNLIKDFRGNEDEGVYTAYEWLNAVYNMKKEPSRNEFDTDYAQYLHEQRVQGKITADQENKLMKDPSERVLYELNNMFPMVNKVTYGRLSTFCPVLSEHDMIKSLSSCIVTTDHLIDAFKKLEAIDYKAYYRETIYTDDKLGIAKEYVSLRIRPDVILFPNIGTRGVMWQEIEGKKRTTPARFMVSVFHMEDLVNTITRLTGEYRWEMCKREQGARWNDVSDRSLTSEYFDYVQFYRKNSELSSDAKEKIKNALSKAKNSFKEMFVRDYITWVVFEGAGSPRLNKIARNIMMSYCPFPSELRKRVGANPMFKDIIERYDIKIAQKLHHLDNVITKIKSTGNDVPPQLEEHRNVLEGVVKNY